MSAPELRIVLISSQFRSEVYFKAYCVRLQKG